MGKKYLWLALVLATVVFATMAFTPGSERAEMAAIFGLMASLVAVLQVPKARRFILRHPRITITLGVGAVAISLVVLFSTLSASSVDPKSVGTAAAFLILIGLFAIFLPFMAKRAEKDVAAWKSTEMVVQGKPGTFNPEGEVRAVLAELNENRGALLRVVGPWFLLFCGLPMVFINVDYWKGLADHDRGSAMMIVLGVLVVFLAELAFLFAAMILWTRFAATKQEPRLAAFPGKALWGWAWRWLIYGALFRSLDRIEPWLKTQLPGAAQWQLDGVQGLIGLAALVLFSPFALVLPAVALNAADKGIAASMRGFRLVGRRYYLGAALILAPYAVASWALSVLYEYEKGTVALAVNAGASLVLFFVTAIVGMTYQTRIYLWGTVAPTDAT